MVKHCSICPKCGKIIILRGRGLPTFLGGKCNCYKYNYNGSIEKKSIKDAISEQGDKK